MSRSIHFSIDLHDDHGTRTKQRAITPLMLDPDIAFPNDPPGEFINPALSPDPNLASSAVIISQAMVLPDRDAQS